MRTKRIMCALLLIVFVSATMNTVGAARPKIAGWTFMVYMVADNNLDAWAYENLELMQTVELTEEVNVVVLWDGYDKPAYLYKVVYGGRELVGGFPLNGEEVNMGDPDTLEAFVDFVTRKFGAQHYLLDLWDHGNDFSGSCYDEHPVDHLTHDEVVAGLEGHHIDILAYDACLEAMIEVAYEYNALGMETDYLVACENYVPLYGYPYDVILDSVTKNPDMPALEFAVLIADEYARYYEPRAHFNGGVMGTLSVIDLSTVDEAVAELSQLTEALEAKLEESYDIYRKIISEARGEGNLPWAEYGWEYYIDLPTFINDLEANRKLDPDIRGLASAVRVALEEVVVHVANTEPMDSVSALGLGIWFPPSEKPYLAYRGLLRYENLQFASQGWVDFLYAYWNLS
ncbi:MAG: clostripain-related cysteine peptidase [Candidatus Bathyarchaeota archaeon]|nr:clostripain-related cysteine peptidase [Candidatus Bathyarchaeota archaeon]MDH5713060.1 clostripain-related cysteine peptidase [Candidatus Bathyarchaeota archaeon]